MQFTQVWCGNLKPLAHIHWGITLQWRGRHRVSFGTRNIGIFKNFSDGIFNKVIFMLSTWTHFVTQMPELFVPLTLVINFRTVLSTKALVLQSFIIHIKLLHHVVVELVPTSTSATTKRKGQKKMEGGQNRDKENIRLDSHSSQFATSDRKLSTCLNE